ncbi:MAG: beta-glucosidase BglX [Lactobacillus sp.]|uniref:beta-glucosidase n=1 Tax=Bombilactobacillus bombi TaxID=1303590 RepID=A0A3R6UZ57_9LACO|nr:beta-glucosidase BglX [Bombilactobacillus bombi]MCO6543333.1 beta-glucosidase BglX [Lactobacillus sp.]RHW51223.1 beta-glucosidase BglX [Bombilactobacillus bombi]
MEEVKLKELFSDLTLEEKIGQLVQLSGEFFQSKDISYGPQHKLGISSRTTELVGSILNVTGAKETQKLQNQQMKLQPHHIPVLFMSDIIYGYKTIFPIPLGMGSTWNPDLVKKAFSVAAEEAAVSGNHVAFAPMVDVVRDARWGRVLESPGEDTYLNSQLAQAMVYGLQNNLSNKKGQISCVKHYAAYGAVESGKEYNAVDMSLSKLFQNYLPPYKAAIDAGCKMVMTSLSTFNGIPVTADKWLLQDILRKQWKFSGVIISDYSSVYELIKHGFAQDQKDAAKKAINAGIDIDMKSPIYANELQGLVTNGTLDIKKINDACWRVLKMKNYLGLFENPYFGSKANDEKQILLTSEKRALSRQVAEEAIVLLKNKNNLLPLSTTKKVALIGPYADEKSLIGMWAVHGDVNDCISIKEGLKKYFGNNLTSEKGTDIIRDRDELLGLGFINENNISNYISPVSIEKENHKKAVMAAKNADIIIMALGEHTLESGEAGAKQFLSLPDNQLKLLDDLTQLKKPIIVINISGRPLELRQVVDKVDAVIQAWFPGTEGGNAIANIIVGNVNPSGRLSITFPYSVGQEPIYYSHLKTGRSLDNSQHEGRFVSRYIDGYNTPLFPFGYGLSYGKVKYHDLVIDNDTISKDDSIHASVIITNESSWSQKETVQVYFHDDTASIVQPVKRLVAFKKISLNAYQSRKITFNINSQKFSFFNNYGEQKLESGKFHLYVGPDSENVKEAKFTIV